MNKPFVFILSIFCLLSVLQSQPFALSDSDPDSPEFRKRFLASYGVHADIEPQLNQKDRPLYEKVAPFLASNPNRAIQIVQQEITPESNAAFDFLLGNLYYANNNFSAAEPQMRNAIKKFPSFRRAHRTLALINVQLEQFKESIPLWLKVITLGGGDAQSYGLLAYAYLTEEKFGSALQAYRMARMFDPDSLDFKRGEAQCLLASEKYLEAIILFDELLKDHPEKKEFWLLQANAFIAEEKYRDAISNLEIAKGIGGADWPTHSLLGNIYLNQGMVDLSLSSYLQALRSEPDLSLDKVFSPLETLLSSRLFAEAASYLDAVDTLITQPLSPKYEAQKALARASIFVDRGEYPPAQEILDSIIAKDPVNSTALLLYGELEQAIDNYSRAEFYFERAANLSGSEAKAFERLGSLAVAQGKYPQAINYFERSLQYQDRPNIRQYLERLKSLVR